MKHRLRAIPKKILFAAPIAVILLTVVGVTVTKTHIETATAAAQEQSRNTVAVNKQAEQAKQEAAAKKADEAKKEQDKQKVARAKTVAAASSSPQPYQPVSAPSPLGKPLYVSPANAQAGRPAQIASQPVGTWFGGWTPNVTGAAHSLVTGATSKGSLAVIVAYNIPARDCGSYSAGGAGSSVAYRAWIRALAAGIGKRQAIVILEPDALAQINCLNASDQANRYADLADAVSVLASQTKASVYLDAGHSAWVDAGTMASRLQKANVAQARGFALNVSNFQTTASNVAYGNGLAARISKSFVIDTSRNGLGPNGEWCNPRGRALGAAPTTSVGGSTDAYLWVKQPGESDGTCGGGPAAGEWWDEYARELIRNAGY